MDYYGMDGQKLTIAEWVTALEEDNDSRTVAHTKLPAGVWISTVLLGLDYSFGSAARPLIFESMVFGPDDMADLDVDRYATKEEAMDGHERLVTKWTGWTPGESDPEED